MLFLNYSTGIFMLNPTYGMDTIGSCQASGFHPHNQSSVMIMSKANISQGQNV